MTRRWPGLRQARWLALTSVLAVSAGYLFQLPVVIPLGSGVLGALTVGNFHDGEGFYRWTRARSSVVFPDPGPGRAVRVEALVSGFRPHGQTPPRVVLEAGGERVQARLSRRGEVLSLRTTTRGWWSSSLAVRIRSETFTPGELDQRALGVRVHEIKLVPEDSRFGLAWAPARQLVFTTLGLLLLFSLLVRHGRSPERAFPLGVLAAWGWGAAFALVRPYAAIASMPFLVASALAAGLDLVFPAGTRVVAEAAREALRRLLQGLQALASKQAAAFVVIGAVGVTAAYWARPRIEIDLGSGRETTLVHRFAGFDQEGGVKFRRALQGAWVDLGDFGGAARWELTVTAALVGGGRRVELARAGEEALEADLSTEWTSHRFAASVPLGWHSGLRLAFPSASEAAGLRIARVRVHRGRSLPSPRVVVLVVGSALLLMAAFLAAGLERKASWLAAGLLLVAEWTALVVDPLLAVPFVGTFFTTVVAGAVFVSVTSGFLVVLARRNLLPEPVPVALAAAGGGFIAWLTTMLFPLYKGGHFVFHSSIAEEIWRGKFMTFYLPYPGSMLSRQAQWGNILVPHSCLYHTLMAPLAALPREWFYGLEKAGLAGMLGMMALVASLLATRVSREQGPIAGACAGTLAATLPPTFQLLGLGHLITLFGCWAATLALGFIILRLEELTERWNWLWATLLLTLCFLSYTASLLFTIVVLAAALPILLSRAPRPARALAGATLVASAAAFFLYYVNWAAPFLRESVPAILRGTGSENAAMTSSYLWNRLVAVPGKLTYTFSSPLFPLGGVVGLVLALRSSQTVLLASWAGVLFLFTGLDLFFNFLLKHHYFVMPVLSAGAGLVAARLWRKGRWGRGMVVAFVVYMAWAGGNEALRVALGAS